MRAAALADGAAPTVPVLGVVAAAFAVTADLSAVHRGRFCEVRGACEIRCVRVRNTLRARACGLVRGRCAAG